jgi:hypothetical protein
MERTCNILEGALDWDTEGLQGGRHSRVTGNLSLTKLDDSFSEWSERREKKMWTCWSQPVGPVGVSRSDLSPGSPEGYE